MNEIDENKELEKMAPLLHSIQKPRFQAPEGYFEQFPERLMRKVEREETKVIRINRNWIKYAMAASIVLVLGFTASIFFMDKPAKESVSFAFNDVDEYYLYQMEEQALMDYALTNDKIPASETNNIEEIYEVYLDEQDIISEL